MWLFWFENKQQITIVYLFVANIDSSELNNQRFSCTAWISIKYLNNYLDYLYISAYKCAQWQGVIK